MIDEERANSLTRVLIVTIGGPAIVIAVGELVARPFWLLLRLGNAIGNEYCKDARARGIDCASPLK